MHRDRWSGTWKQWVWKVRGVWGRLAGRPALSLAARQEVLVARLQVAYGRGRERARAERPVDPALLRTNIRMQS